MSLEPVPVPGWPTRDGRVVTFAWNLASRYTLIVATALLGVVVLPFNLRYLGESDYGLWMLVASVTTYFSVLELGYGGAIVRFVAEYRTRNDARALNEILSTMFYVFSGMGVLAYGAAIVVAVLLPYIFTLEPGQVAIGRTVLLIIALNVALHFVFSVYGGVINGFERYYVNNIVGGAFNIGAALVNLIVLWLGFGLVELVGATTAMRVAPYFFYWRNAHVAFPELSIRRAYFRKERLRELTGFGLYMAVIDWSARLTYTADLAILGMFFNTAAVAVYAIAQRLAEALLRLTNQLHTFLFPVVVSQAVEGGIEEQRRLFVKVTRFQLATSVALCGCVAAVADTLIRAWVGPGYDTSAAILPVLAAVVVLRTLMAMPATVLKGTGHHRFVAIASAWCAVASLLLSVAAVQILGVSGVAWGTLLPAAVLSAGGVFPRTCRLVGVRVGRAYRLIVWPALWPAVIVIALLALTRQAAAANLLTVLMHLGLGALLYAVLFFFRGLDRAERRWFVQAFRKILGRRRPWSNNGGPTAGHLEPAARSLP